MTQPVRIGNALLYLGDCREVMPTLDRVDAVVADPPYGIGKAEWDTEFSLDWFDDAARLADTIAVMPGTWNLLALPQERAGMRYKWTLSAHLSNGMTRGAMGWGNWIPCVVYKRDLGGDQPERVREWCSKFAAWCVGMGITPRAIDEACGTSDMGHWYLGTLAYRCQIPTPRRWALIQAAFAPPQELAPQWGESYRPKTDCKAFAVGNEPKPDHPSPKPLNVTGWFVETVGGKNLCDPFMGSGTTGVACALLGKGFVGIERDLEHFKTACRRIEAAYQQADLLVRSAEVPAKQEALL